jgi:hypothetical protein
MPSIICSETLVIYSTLFDTFSPSSKMRTFFSFCSRFCYSAEMYILRKSSIITALQKFDVRSTESKEVNKT